MHRIDTRTAPAIYIALMGVWVYGFAASERELPPLLVFGLLLIAGAIQVGAGYAVGRWEGLALAAVPLLVAFAAAGRDSTLWMTVAVLMVFPGAPLLAGGVALRRWQAERRDESPDSWLYGEPPRG